MRPRSPLAPIALAFASAALAAVGEVPEPGSANGDDRRERGALLFRLHCAGCHGEDGSGGGPEADRLEIDAPDLGRLARRRDGRFPAEDLHRIIDGRAALPGHDERGMPVWGLSFQEPGRDSPQELEVRERIEDLIEFIRSLQKPPS